jgi:hypothetical protein
MPEPNATDASVTYTVNTEADGASTNTFTPLYADSGSSDCPTIGPVTLVGYLTRIPLGQT